MRKNRAKMLFLSLAFPLPADSGGKIKTLQTLSTLAPYYEIHAVFISEHKELKRHANKLRRMGVSFINIIKPDVVKPVKHKIVKAIKHMLIGLPHYAYQYGFTDVRYIVERLLSSLAPDVIHIDHIAMAQYLPKMKHEVWVLEAHNCEAQLLWNRLPLAPSMKGKLYLTYEAIATFFFERRQVMKFDHVFCLSREDQNSFKRLYGTERISIQKLIYKTSLPIAHHNTSQPIILFIGSLFWPPNLDAVSWFLKDILPQVQRDVPSARFEVIGNANEAIINTLPKNASLYIYGYQRTLDLYLARASVFVLPFRVGGGVRMKTFTALSSGIPIVSTSFGIRGLDLVHNRDCFVADDPNEFARKVVTLLHDKMKRRQIAANGFTYMARNHTSDTHYLRMYNEIATT